MAAANRSIIVVKLTMKEVRINVKGIILVVFVIVLKPLSNILLVRDGQFLKLANVIDVGIVVTFYPLCDRVSTYYIFLYTHLHSHLNH